jgi:1-deoxy-D-xylulose-5-phosphate synthase
MLENGYTPSIKRLGIPDKFIEHGSERELCKICGLDVDSILKEIRSFSYDKSPDTVPVLHHSTDTIIV